MNHRKFGRTGLHVSELCLNTEPFGWINDDTLSLDLLDTYLAEGGRFIQTVGSGVPFRGEIPLRTQSEEIVGNWLQFRKVPRDQLVLSTRIGFSRPVHGGGVAFANFIRESCEQSLRRLRSTHLDLLVCEWNEDLVPVEDAAAAFDMLIRAGLVRYAVASGFPSWRVSDSLHRATLRDRCRFDGLQAEYSLMTRERFESEDLIMAREYRLGLLVHSPLANGFLSASWDSIKKLTFSNDNWLSERFGSHHGDAVRATLAEIAETHAATPAQVALAWVLRDPQVTSALLSPSSTGELRNLTRASNLVLTLKELTALDIIKIERNSRMELHHT